MTFFKWCEDAISKITSRQWWKETAWSKIEKNWLDLTAVGVFMGGSIFMAASVPAITITITALAIGTSIYLDMQHTKEKRALFDKRKRQIQLGDETVIADPSWFEEKIKKGGLGLSVGAAIVYIGVASWTSWEAARSIWLEVFYGVDIFLAISSCHIGRKIYDMKLGAGLAAMEVETDKILENSGLKNSDMAERQRNQLENIVQLRVRYRDLITTVERFSREVERQITPVQRDLLNKAISEEKSSTAYISEVLGNSEESIEPITRKSIIERASYGAARDTERQVLSEGSSSPTPTGANK